MIFHSVPNCKIPSQFSNPPHKFAFHLNNVIVLTKSFKITDISSSKEKKQRISANCYKKISPQYPKIKIRVAKFD